MVQTPGPMHAEHPIEHVPHREVLFKKLPGGQ